MAFVQKSSPYRTVHFVDEEPGAATKKLPSVQFIYVCLRGIAGVTESF